MPNSYPKTEFDATVSRVADECFRIAGWMAFVSVLVAAGKKLDFPLALVLGYLLMAVLAVYVGVRASEMMWRGFRRQQRGAFGKRVIDTTGPVMGALIWYAAYSVSEAVAKSGLF